MKAIVTVDIGTTSVRAIVFDETGRAVHMDQSDNAPTYFGDGRVEQDPRSWLRLLVALLRRCADFAGSRDMVPTCVAVTAQRSSVMPVDVAGEPLHPAIMWQDARCADLSHEFAASNEFVYRSTGLKISPVFSALKMTWLRRHRPDIWQATHKLLGVQDWALYQLTGRFVTDQSFGSRTNLLDLETRRWSPELLSLFGVPGHMLCDLVVPGAVVGGLSAAMAASTHLKAGLPVVSAGGDQQCAALGLGLFSSAYAVSNTGTGSYLIGHSDKPVLDPGMRVSCNISAVPGACIVEAAVLTSGAVYQWFNDRVLRAGGDAPGAFEALNEEAAGAPAGAGGLLLLPHFKGCGSPHWDPDARGVFCNMSLATTRGEMARAILEAIAVELKESLELVEQLCGIVRSVHVSGGMTQLPLFNQIQSDVFERPVQRFSGNEATSQGAWIAGAVATGLAVSHAEAFARMALPEAAQAYQPDVATQATYRQQRRRSRAVYEALAAPWVRELFK
jgi:sugar (pentulose or hexulose) kinase